MPSSYISGPVKVGKASSKVAGDLKLPVKGRMRERIMIGRREWLSLPDFGVDIISAKVDTGAYTSSLHAEEIEVIEREGAEWVRFATSSHHGEVVQCEVPLVQRKRIKSSNGKARERLIVKTVARAVGGFEWEVYFSLADRSVMKCPLLLGRKALSGYFVVDTQASHLFGNTKNLTGKPHHRRS